ncbi:MAG: PQQ-dependent sugar dehydrogenase [Pseudomonadota bacterium]
MSVDGLTLPPGFSVSVYARVENARQMALGDDGVIYVGSRAAGKVHAVIDDDNDQRADKVVVIRDELELPSGLAYRDGDLYVGAVSTIYRFNDIAKTREQRPSPDVLTSALPTEKHHGWKYLKFAPDGHLYIPVGAPCNVCEREEPFATIVRMDVERPNELETVARGVRNSVGFDWDPVTGDLWFTDNGRDWLGDDTPPCELNHVTELGQHFGFPYLHGNDVVDPEFGGNGGDVGRFQTPALALGPHVAPLGMTFYQGDTFPSEYIGDIFLVEHGSWNRTPEAGPTGYRVIRVRRDEQGLHYEVFIDGWLNEDNEAWGRPADVLGLPDGSLLISDDKAGAIYRISYAQPE